MKSYKQRKIQQKYRQAKKTDKEAEVLEAVIVVIVLVLLLIINLKTEAVPVKVDALPLVNLIASMDIRLSHT